THCLNSYRDDMEFLAKVQARVASGKPLFVRFDREHPLETFQLLFYGNPRAILLRNLSFLRNERIAEREVYILGHSNDNSRLGQYGDVRMLLRSKHPRGEASRRDRRALFHLRFFDDLERKPGDVYISPMQAASRKAGPYLH